MSEIKVNKVSSRTGNAVTLGTSGDTFTIPAGVTLTNSGTATGFGSDSDISWQSIVTSNTTMVAGRGYFVDSSGGAITMTLFMGKAFVLYTICCLEDPLTLLLS